VSRQAEASEKGKRLEKRPVELGGQAGKCIILWYRHEGEYGEQRGQGERMESETGENRDRQTGLIGGQYTRTGREEDRWKARQERLGDRQTGLTGVQYIGRGTRGHINLWTRG
jgi:hypothetical protein